MDYSDEVLTLLFQSEKDVEVFKNSQGAAEVLRQVIFEAMGVKVKYRAKVAEAPEPRVVTPIIEPTAPEEFTTEEELADQDPTEAISLPVVAEMPEDEERAGEFVLREILGATPLKDKDK